MSTYLYIYLTPTRAEHPSTNPNHGLPKTNITVFLTSTCKPSQNHDFPFKPTDFPTPLAKPPQTRHVPSKSLHRLACLQNITKP